MLLDDLLLRNFLLLLRRHGFDSFGQLDQKRVDVLFGELVSLQTAFELGEFGLGDIFLTICGGGGSEARGLRSRWCEGNGNNNDA